MWLVTCRTNVVVYGFCSDCYQTVINGEQFLLSNVSSTGELVQSINIDYLDSSSPHPIPSSTYFSSGLSDWVNNGEGLVKTYYEVTEHYLEYFNTYFEALQNYTPGAFNTSFDTKSVVTVGCLNRKADTVTMMEDVRDSLLQDLQEC